MLATMGAILDRRVGLILMSGVRRRWPLMRLVPGAVMLPLLAPVTRRVRRSVVRVASVGLLVATVVAATVLIAAWQ